MLSTVQHYDSLGRLTKHLDPAQGETHLKHHSHGQISQVTAANDARTSYIYDGLGQLLQEHSFDTGTRIHHYDTAGQRIRSHGPEQPKLAAQYHYDALGRLTHIQAPNSADDVYYHYDQHEDQQYGIGRLTAIEDRHSRIDYRYDRHGNLLSDRRTLNIDGQSHTQQTNYSYTHGNQLASITYPNGQRIDYHFRQGQPDSITLQENKQQKVLVSDIQHRPFGPIKEWRNGNGLSQQLNYDLDGRTTAVSVSHSASDAVWQQHYQYDLLNNITGIERTENRHSKTDTLQQQFSYDAVQRLIRDRGNDGEQQFTYDKVGNRLRHVRLEQEQTLNDDSSADSQSQAHREDYNYAPASNRLLGTSEKQMLLDQVGNLLQESRDRTRAYRYNAQNRISEYSENGQLKARYHYNALGQRIHKAVMQADGTEQHTLFHYGQQGELLGETQVNSADTSEASHTQNIVWLQMRPVVVLDSSANSTNSKAADTRISWLHSDHLLTARAATDINQNLIWRWHSDAFGVGEAESFANESAKELTLNLRFPGQYYDQESGQHYNYFRTYDPSMGRYTQSDPIGLMGGMNTFAYVGGSPLLAMDPLGLMVQIVLDTSSNKLTITDAERSLTFVVEAFTGGEIDEGVIVSPGVSPQIPAPKGEYYIVDNPNPRQGTESWFGLFYKDDRIDDYVDINGVTRSGIRLHGGSVSHGCVGYV